jgi:glutamyl-tRNA reductase
MPLFALGINHRTAPLSVREQLVFQPNDIGRALHALLSVPEVSEAAILSTCNRTEVYCSLATGSTAAPLSEWLASYNGVTSEHLNAHLYHHPQQAAIRHMFRVASGLDSMVLGEPQILGQMKQAARLAGEAGTLGTTLGKLFQRTFAVAKEVRSTTAIGANIVSMAAAAVHLSGRVFDQRVGLKILFIGAGEMIELCLAHFAAQGPKRITIANRTVANAAALADRFKHHNIDTIALAEVDARLAEYDIVVSCTASPLPILGLGMVERALKIRRHRPMVMVDLAVPRDIESEVSALDDIFLYTLDDLGQFVESGLEARQGAVIDAEKIISAGVEGFEHWLQARDSVPTIRVLRERAERTRVQALDAAMKQLARGEDPARVLETLSQGLTNKLLHGPTQALNSASGDARVNIAVLISQIYQLQADE